MKNKILHYGCLVVGWFWLTACSEVGEQTVHSEEVSIRADVFFKVLGIYQDAGSPHIGCWRECCRGVSPQEAQLRRVVALGLVDRVANQSFLIEATPDIATQTADLQRLLPDARPMPDGILLTHAHIGHYSGLMYLGKEAMNTHAIPVFAMPRMRQFLMQNGPWNQLIADNNIVLNQLKADSTFALTEQIRIKPYQVPHRDEYSETVGFRIQGPNRAAFFIPDIDKWEKWEHTLEEVLHEVDYALVDATFYDAEEIGHRDIRQIPHPFVVETMQLLAKLPLRVRQKVHFIHLNHTNPLADPKSETSKAVEERGFQVARQGLVFAL